MLPTQHLLIGDLQSGVTDSLFSILKTQHYVVTTAEGREKLLESLNNTIDLLLLDLPSTSELALVTEIRQKYTKPIIAIGPPRNDRLLITALEYGVDDFIQRPFNTSEFLARVRAQLRRLYKNSDYVRTLNIGALQVNIQTREALLHTKPVDLTPNEYDLLTVLATQPGHVYSANYLLMRVWGARSTHDFDLLQLTIHYLRRRIEEDPTTPKFICGDLRYGFWLGHSVTA